MGVLVVHCCKCGKDYQIYKAMSRHEYANICPFCFSELPRREWERIVLTAFEELEDANRELIKEHTGYNDIPLFQVGYIPDAPGLRMEGKC